MFSKKYLINLTLYIIILMASYNQCVGREWTQEDLDCVACLCYVKTNCYDLQKCANYTISFEYWRKANVEQINVNDDSNRAYQQCMLDDECIEDTILEYHKKYLESEDCVCDGVYDCRDKLSMHFSNHQECTRNVKPYQAVRYNKCATAKNRPLVNPNIECIHSIAV